MIGKLYIKLLLSFILVLIVTEILIFLYFMVGAAGQFKTRFERMAKAQATITRELVEDKIRADPGRPLAENERLRDLVVRLGVTYDSKVWLTDRQGRVIHKSFTGDPPTAALRGERVFTVDGGSYRLHRLPGRRYLFQAAVPIDPGDGRRAVLHLAAERGHEVHPESGFALALIVIGLAVALLLIPVTRLITGRIGRLEASALRIADGDLSHRAEVSGRDEIGQLGRAFNAMADRVERMIRGGRELTANVSHELRTPMTRLRIAVELLKEKRGNSGSADWEDRMAGMEEDIAELDRLIGRILDLSRLDLSESALETGPVDLSLLIENTVSRFEAAARANGIALEKEIESDVWISANEESLASALSCLLDNAVKFTPHGGRATVELESGTDGPVIRLTNPAEALSEGDLSGIFEPFQRIGPKGKAGYGLGLAIVKKTVERHGGRVQARNLEGAFILEVFWPRPGGVSGFRAGIFPDR